MAKSKLIIFMSFLFMFAATESASAGDVRTTGYFPLKEGKYNTISTTGDTVLAADGGTSSVSIGAAGENGAALTVTGDASHAGVLIGGSLEAQDALQIETCQGCIGTAAAPQTPGRIYLDVYKVEEPA